MIDQDLLVRNIVEATTDVFSTMLDTKVEVAGPADQMQHCPSRGIISLVGITGNWGGSGVFCCSPMLAAILCARMLGNDIDTVASSIDEEVLDVVAELTNMIIGNVKNSIEATTGPLAISVPTVIHGRNFEFRNTSGLSTATIAFSTDGQVFEVRISLAPVADQSVTRSRIPILGLAHM